MKKYNKLVRDLIPEVIEADGKKCETEIVYGEEKTKFLEDKLKEEVNEYLEDKNYCESLLFNIVSFHCIDSLLCQR